MTRTVTIIGAGPAGLTAARTLRAAGVDDVLVLERNPECGGLPRFCGHPGWGMIDFHRLWDGPTYA
uniref:FAD-dependent oxidoreductase n=1 Tax=Klebsiella pneumoniae TaxID=573 RepID=UPI001953434A